jgi:transcription elongation factor GreA
MIPKIFYITKEKLKELRMEYERLLITEKEKNAVEKAPKILESDDLSPEFVSFQEDVEILRSRIDELGNVIENHEIIKKPSKDKQNIIGVGAKILVDAGGQKAEFAIMGTLEANPALGKISNESPVGRAFLGHKVGDEVIVDSPVKVAYKIKKIKYEIN